MMSELNDTQRKMATMLAAEIRKAADNTSVALVKTENLTNNLGVIPELAIAANIIKMRTIIK